MEIIRELKNLKKDEELNKLKLEVVKEQLLNDKLNIYEKRKLEYEAMELDDCVPDFEKRINDPPRTSYVTPSYITQDYNTAVTFPIFKAIGYTFVRWVDVNNYTYTTINYLTGDIILYAVWQKKDTITFSELNRVYNGTRGGNPPSRGVNSISIGKFRAESGRGATESIKLITHFQGKGL
jgi:hypothetical protein